MFLKGLQPAVFVIVPSNIPFDNSRWKKKSFWRNYVRLWIIERDSCSGHNKTKFSLGFDYKGGEVLYFSVFCGSSTASYTNGNSW